MQITLAVFLRRESLGSKPLGQPQRKPSTDSLDRYLAVGIKTVINDAGHVWFFFFNEKKWVI